MVALVKCEDAEGLAERLAQGSPVLQRAEQAVQNKKGMTMTIGFTMEGHAVLFTPRSGRGEGVRRSEKASPLRLYYRAAHFPFRNSSIISNRRGEKPSLNAGPPAIIWEACS